MIGGASGAATGFPAVADPVLSSVSDLLGAVPPAQLVGAGGALGAVVRYVVGEAVERETFPYSVVLVNVAGTFLASLLAFAAPASEVALLVAVGFCGALTTFSTFSFQTVHLWEQDRRTAAAIHAGGTLAACLLGVAAAWLLVALT